MSHFMLSSTDLRATARKARPTTATAVRWWTGWEFLAILPQAAVLFNPATWPRWALMWLVAISLYAGCKWLTWRRTSATTAPAWMQLGYLLAWPGLDAAAFLQRPAAKCARPTPAEWLFAASKLLVGLAIVFALARLVPAAYPYCRGWVGMAGIVLSLHFGLFHLLSCFWRNIGIDARPLMHWPIAATSVSDFWGHRWNTAFRDLTHRFLFRPLTPRWGAKGAIFAGFIFSGLIHDLVISLPAGGGYGGPTIFFLISGLALFVERSRLGRMLGLGRGWRGWLFTAVVLLAPAPLLFHPPFVERIVVPFLQAIGAL